MGLQDCGFSLGAGFPEDPGIPHCGVTELLTVPLYNTIPFWVAKNDPKLHDGIKGLKECTQRWELGSAGVHWNNTSQAQGPDLGSRGKSGFQWKAELVKLLLKQFQGKLAFEVCVWGGRGIHFHSFLLEGP